MADADTLPLKTYANLFLAALPPKELRLLQPDLRLVEFPRGTTLNDAGDRIDDVLFVESGMVSLLTTMSDGAAIENATLGRESILGVMGALGSHRTHMRAIVQIPVTGYRIRSADFRVATDKSPHLRQLVLRSSELLMAQLQQTAACNALPTTPSVVCGPYSQCTHTPISGSSIGASFSIAWRSNQPVLWSSFERPSAAARTRPWTS